MLLLNIEKFLRLPGLLILNLLVRDYYTNRRGILKQTCHSFGEIRIIINIHEKFFQPLLLFALFFIIDQVCNEDFLPSNWMGGHLRCI